MPNQPKTPITSFRLDDETKDRLRRMAEAMDTTMTEGLKRAVVAGERAALVAKGLGESVRAAQLPKGSLARFVVDRLDEDIAALPDKGDDPFTPYGQHWSEVPFPMASAGRSFAALTAMRSVALAVSDPEWATYSVRDVVLEHLAAPYAEHEDFKSEWRSR